MNEIVPVYERIKRDIKAQIDGNLLAEGDHVPSEHELSEQLKVSRHQTRQALRELEIEGYVLRSQGRRSVVAPASKRAMALPLDSTGVVAIALQVLDTLYTRGIFEGAMARLVENHLQSIMYNLYFNKESEVQFLRHVRGMGVAGLIIWLDYDQEESRRLLDAYRQASFPVVLIDRYLDGCDTDFVVTDNVEMTYRLTQHLIEQGHTRIGYIGDPHVAASGRDRLKGYRRALEEAGLPWHKEFSGIVHKDAPAAEATVRQIMSYRNPPTAFCCIHDLYVPQLVAILNRLGYRVPDDIELASVSDQGAETALGISMFTAAQPSEEIGRQAVEVLLARIEHPDRPPDQRFLPPIWRSRPRSRHVPNAGSVQTVRS